MFKKIEIKYPTHIGFIMDGNRRWATSRGLNKMLGHKQGAIALAKLVEELQKTPIKFASFFAFSTENWKRDPSEIEYIFQLIYDWVEQNEEKYNETNLKLVCMGQLERFPKKLQDILKRAQEKTKNNDGLVVNLAMSYGGRADIVRAAQLVAESGKEITEENLGANLYSAPAPDIDLLIRTSGELRVSNFMLWQAAYSELYFTKVNWPDFDKKQLDKAVLEFSKRHRRFGK